MLVLSFVRTIEAKRKKILESIKLDYLRTHPNYNFQTSYEEEGSVQKPSGSKKKDHLHGLFAEEHAKIVEALTKNGNSVKMASRALDVPSASLTKRISFLTKKGFPFNISDGMKSGLMTLLSKPEK
jgi:hypothetical protein